MAEDKNQDKNQGKKAIDEQNVYIRDTLMSIAAKYGEVLKEAVEDAFDSAEASVLNAVGKDLTRSFTKLAKMSDEFANNESKIRKGLISQKDIEKQIQSVKDKQESLARKIEHARRLGLEVSEEDKKAAEESLKVQLEMLEADKQLAKSLSGRIALQKTGDELKKKFRIDEIEDLFTIAGLLKAIVEGALRFNKLSVDISKNLGYAGNAADGVALNMAGVAITSNNINVNMKSLGEAMSELSAATGGVAENSADALETQVMLTKQFGLTGEEAAGIYKFSTLTGKSSSQVNKEMVAAFASTRNMVKGSANFQRTMAEAAKVSGQLSANFRNNPAAITAAVVKMQALGTTLEQTKKQGDSLLDFESSIENELKAELLTGKQLNLERARAAALTGDQVTLAEELAKNVGTIDDFNKMNVLQQKSLAEAMGMSADELANQLQKQKTAKEQGKSLAQVQADELEAAQKRQNVQDRFNALVEKLMDMIGMVGILLDPLIRAFEFITDNAYVLYGVLGLIALTRLPAIAKFFTGIGSSIKDAAKNATKLFSKEGRAGLFGKGAGGGVETKTPEVPTPETKTPGKGMGGIMESLKGIKTTDMIKGAAAILILAGALFVAAKAFQEFATVKWEDVGKGVVGIGALAGIAFLLGKAQKDMTKGALAVAILGAALIPFAIAMSFIANLDMKAVLAAAAGLVIFGAAVFGLGAIMASGIGAAFFEAGIVAILQLGAAMMILGLGLKVVADAGTGITALFKQLTELDVEKLNTIAPALGTIGAAVLELGAGTLLTAIGGILGGEGPVGIIRKISESGDGLQKAATGLQGVAAGLTQVASALSAIDTSKLEALSDFSVKMSIGSAVKGITDFITAPIKAIGGAIEGGGAADNTPMITAINEVRDAVNKLYAKNTDVYIDSVKVTTASQKAGNYRLA